MKKIFLLFALWGIVQSPLVYAQILDANELGKQPVFTNLKKALKNPELVYRLDLSGQKISKFPDEILKFRNLQWLDLSLNALSTLPEEIASLSNLQKLILTGNKLEELPKAIGALSSLQTLDLSGNLLIALVEDLYKLKNLERLDCSDNKISNPFAVVTLAKLKSYNISGNVSVTKAAVALLIKEMPNCKITSDFD